MPKITYEYGKALYELSCELDMCNEYLTQVRLLRNIIYNDPELITVLSSPIIPKNERIKIVDHIFEDSFETNICSFIKLLTERGRAKEIISCLDEFEKLWYEQSGIVIAEAVSAVPLSNDQISRLHFNLEAKTQRSVELRTKVDPSLIGGIKVTLNGKLIDGTVVGRLKKIKENLSN